MPRMTLISATSESRIFSDWRFWAITASKRRFSIRTASSRASATRSPAADRAHPPQAARRARGGREKRGGPLHPDGDLLAPRLHVWRQVATVRQALNHPLGVFRRQPLLALQVLAETARAHRQVPRQH